MTQDAQNTTDEWGPWIPHKAGDPCPIPEVIGGEYGVKFADGVEKLVSIHDAIWWSKSDCSWRGEGNPALAITHYRLRVPPIDYPALLRVAVEALECWLKFSSPDREVVNDAMETDALAYCQNLSEEVIEAIRKAGVK